MKKDLNKTNEQLSFELNYLRKISKEREEKLKAVNQQLRAANQQLEANQQQLRASEQQLRAANQQLAASEEKFRIVLDHTYNWEYWIDPKGKFIYVSPSCERITGYTQNEFLQNPKLMTDIVHSDDLAMVKGHRHKVFVTEEVEEIEFRIITKSKKERWIGHICQTVYDDNKINIGQRASNRDITERKQAEKAIQESKKQLQTLINNMPDFVCFKDKDGRWLMANESAIRIFQLEETDYRGKKDSELAELNKKLRGSFLTCKESDARTLNKGGLIHAEETIPGTDGADRIYDVTKVLVSHAGDEQKGLIIIGHDITERKQAEEALRESSEHWKTTFNAIKDSITILDKDNFIIQCNKSTCKLLGKSEEDIIGKKCMLLFHGINKIIDNCPFERLKETKKRESLQFQVLDKWFEVIVDPLIDQAGNLLGAVHVISDITERKQAEEAIRESEEKFKNLANLLPQIVYEIDINGNLTYVNKQAFASFGYSYEEFEKGFNVLQVLIPEDIDRVKENIQNVLYGKDIGNPEYTALRKDGSSFPILIYSSVILKDNKPVGLRGIIIDITERKQAEEALKESEEKYRTFINTASDLMCITDEEEKFTEVNESMINKLEYSRNELIGNHFRTILTKKSIEKDLLPNWDKFIENGKISIETTFLSKKGNELYCVLKGIGIYDDNNKFIGSRAVIHDLTQRKQAEEALKKRMKELEIFNEAAVGRELKIIELKKEINELLAKTGQKPKYEIIE